MQRGIFCQLDRGVSADSDVCLILFSAESAESGMVPVVAAGDLLLSTHLTLLKPSDSWKTPGNAGERLELSVR